jgi:hypothetical protein
LVKVVAVPPVKAALTLLRTTVSLAAVPVVLILNSTAVTRMVFVPLPKILPTLPPALGVNDAEDAE